MESIEEILVEFPSLQYQYEQIKTMGVLKIFLDEDKQENYEKLKQDFEKTITQIVHYNKNFSNNGWIAYDGINFKMIKKANEIYEKYGIEEAEKYIINYYTNEVKNVVNWLYYSSKEFKVRRNLIEEALTKHFNKDYSSAVLLFLTIIDGIINDYTKDKGFFTENVNLDCWDCLVGCSNGLKKLKEIYNKSRKKTNTEAIYFPYRNGILHGRDLNYGNEFVSSKCIVMSFAIKDWISNKKTEKIRIEKYEKEINLPPFEETIEKYMQLQKDKEIISSWKPINIKVGKDVPISGSKEKYQDYEYVYTFVEMIQYWKEKNYGRLAEKLDKMFYYETNKSLRPKECRKLFENNILNEFKILKIEDKAICMKNIEIMVDIQKKEKSIRGNMRFGIIYEGENICALPQNENGNWNIYPQNTEILK